jgi:serine/threonine-protein kinase
MTNAGRMAETAVAKVRPARNVRHPNLCGLVEVAPIGEILYLAHEPTEAQDIDDRWLFKGLVVPPETVASVGIQLCAALERLHAHGVVHAGVCPHRISINGMTVKLRGVGSAFMEGGAIRMACGTVRGRMRYLAPEQTHGLPADARTDLFSLGVVLWGLVRGELLFKGNSDLEDLLAVRDAPIAELPGALGAVIGGALERDADARWPSAQAMGDALRAI